MTKSLLKSKTTLSMLTGGGPIERSTVDGDADMISRKTYFHQECATCGRTLQVRVEYLGRQIACQHCGAQFEACDPASALYPSSKSAMAVLRRAEELLDAAESGIFKIPTADSAQFDGARYDGYAARPQ
jgi:DNA-directed RNA polymerase subunit RPC12/RpoP